MGASCGQDEAGGAGVTGWTKEISGHFRPESAAKAVCNLV